jgi:hypothetical protein
MGKVTSGQLAIANHYCISRKMLLENLESKQNVETEKKSPLR